MVHGYSIDESIDKFSIGYMINPSFHFNKVFREKVENSQVLHLMKGQWKQLKIV